MATRARLVFHPKLDFVAIRVVLPRDYIVDHVGVPIYDSCLREGVVPVEECAPVRVPVVAFAASENSGGKDYDGNELLHFAFFLV